LKPQQTKHRSKSIAAWLALTLGTLGAHRFYLHGWRDVGAWLHVPPTLLGLAGVIRLRNLGQDDQVAWFLIPMLGLMLSLAMLTAIVYALTPDERWAAKHHQPVVDTTWAPVFAAVLSLFFGGAVLMGTIAYGGQKFFEWQLEENKAASASSPNHP
jgi:TM2 domain-containing membrane protein YozV